MIVAWYKKKWARIIQHVFIWLILFSLPFLLRQSFNNERRTSMDDAEKAFAAFTVFSDILWIGLFYLNANFLIKRYLYTRKVALYLILQVLVLLFIMTMHYAYFNAFIPSRPFLVRNFFLFNIFPYLFILASSITYRLIQDKMKEDAFSKEKENENLKTELSLLRSQVSPHFMFNVLNNMVALARKNSDQLEPSLIKLSSLMRYMLYETDEETVPVEKEIEYLQSYIDLQQQRFGKKVSIKTCFNLADNNYQVEPMLLIPFVENAFKHGTGLVEDAQIIVELKAENKQLHFTVRNKHNKDSEEIKDVTSGIGLPNVQRRLNLLYGKNHQLVITNDGEWFIATLKLNLH